MSKDATITAIANMLADLQAAYDDRDRALAEYLGVGRTDLRCLDLIMRGGPQTASELGVKLHLTRGSMTTLIDRLERAGYVQRRDDPHHGKRKQVLPTPRLVTAIGPTVGARQAQATRELERKSLAELQIILAFLESTLSHQSSITAAYRALLQD